MLPFGYIVDGVDTSKYYEDEFGPSELAREKPIKSIIVSKSDFDELGLDNEFKEWEKDSKINRNF